jgi:hypothetical protein
MMPEHSNVGSSEEALSKRDDHAGGANGVILASLVQSMRKPTSSEVRDGSAPVAATGAAEVLDEGAWEAPMVATLKPSPEPYGRLDELAAGAAAVLALTWWIG